MAVNQSKERGEAQRRSAPISGRRRSLKTTTRGTTGTKSGARYRERQIEAMRRVSELVFAYSSVDDMVRETLEVAVDVLEADVGSLQLHDPQNDTLVFRHVIDPNASLLIGYAVPASQGIDGRVFRTGVSDLSSQVRERSEWNPAVDQQTGYRTDSMLTVPLKSLNGPAIGVVQLLNGRRNFDSYDLEVLEVLCAQAAQAISQVRLLGEAGRRLSDAQVLRNLDLALSMSLDMSVVLSVLAEQVVSHLRVDAVNVLRFQPQTRLLEYVAARGFRSAALNFTRLPLGEGYAGQAALERRIIILPDLNAQIGELKRAALLRTEEFASYAAIPLIARGQIQGVMEVFHRTPFTPPPEWLDFAKALAVQAAIVMDNAALFGALQEGNLTLLTAYEATLEGITHALDLRGREPEGHTRRVADATVRLARNLGIEDAEAAHFRRGALLHNIGKMAVPDSILLKPTPLTEEEWAILKKHPVYAYELLSPIAYLRSALDIPYCHLEQWDGMGYPRGLKGEQIPLGARVFAVVEAWDMLRADRAYRLGWPKEKAGEHLRRSKGIRFDPRIVDAFEDMMW